MNQVADIAVNTLPAAGWRGLRARITAPFVGDIPDHVQGALVTLQYRRLHAAVPLLCLAIAANSIAMALAVMGDLPFWQQIAPPLLLVSLCLGFLLLHDRDATSIDASQAWRRLNQVLPLGVPLGLLAGFWCVNAFVETEKYYCMTAPVFLAITAIVTAHSLIAIPRTAIAIMVAAILPIVVKMLGYDNLGVRSMAIMLLLIALMQSSAIIHSFRETVRALTLQHELNRLAESDNLTGLDNRLAFMRKFHAALDAGQPLLVALADLDGFKQANDTHGHHAGDEVLITVAQRMLAVTPHAISVARLGGDEFALLFDGRVDQTQLAAEIEGVRSAVALPYVVGSTVIAVSTCIGIARTAEHGTEIATLMQAADSALYAEKRGRRKQRRRPLAVVKETAPEQPGSRRRNRG